MKITIVTLWRADQNSSFVGAVRGMMTPEQRRAMAAQFDLQCDDEEQDGIGFREVELAETPEDLRTVKAWYDDESEAGYIEAEEDTED